MRSADMMLILLFLILAYGGPFALGCLFFRIRRAGRKAAPDATRSRAWRTALKLLCAATLLLAYALGHFRVLSYPGAIMLSMILGAPAFFLSAGVVVGASVPVPEEER